MKSQVIPVPEVGLTGAAPQEVEVAKPSVLYRTSNWLGAELLACLKKYNPVTFNFLPPLVEAENSIYELLFTEEVIFKVVELNTLAVDWHVTVVLVNPVPVASVAITGVFPCVGQEAVPSKVFKYKTGPVIFAVKPVGWTKV